MTPPLHRDPVPPNRNSRAVHLGRWLRALRRQTDPAHLGLTSTAHSRCPTQVQIARLCGLTSRTYCHIERGHHLPGPRTVDALVEALRLDPGQIAHLHNLCLAPADRPHRIPEALARQLVDAIDRPAFAADVAGNLVAVNPAMSAAFTDLTGCRLALDGVNVVEWFFTAPLATTLFVDWPDLARDLIAQLRAAHARYRDTAALDEVIARLCAHSAVAARRWIDDATIPTGPPQRTVRLRQPDGGISVVRLVQLQPGDDPDLRITLVLPA